jgi:molybdate transport system permease protein
MSNRKIDPLTTMLAWIAIVVVAGPLIALLAKIPYSHLLTQIQSDHSLRAIGLSLWTSAVALLAVIVLGVPLAWWLTHSNQRLTSLIRPVVLAPIALPPTVAGLALLGFLSRRGLIGTFIYQQTGWQMPFTQSAVIFTGIFIGLPFMVMIAESGFTALPREIEDAATIDRASGSQLFRLIAIPQARASIITGAALAWARILGEFGATMMFAGSLPGVTQTWSMQIYQELDLNPDAAYALSLILLIIALSIVVFLRRPLREAFSR